jgi:SAM-dependent methyltransferase
MDCGSLHINNATLREIDNGKSTRVYDESYWSDELIAARERSQGEALVRAGEAILYARRPVTCFLDVGSGPGYLLDELARQFPQHASMFHGVELFPPEQHSRHANYHFGDVSGLGERFDAGVCVEVVEHLTPSMLVGMIRGLARISKPDTLWLFNTGMPELVLQHDPEYLDPCGRGHIISYSLMGLRHLFEPHGFRLSAVPGKNYLFMAEYQPRDAEIDFDRRVWEPLRENVSLLKEAGLLHEATLESARHSISEAQLGSRMQWVLSLQAELERASRLHAALQLEHKNVAEWAQSLDSALRVLREQHVTLQSEYDRIMHSRSWILTSPLRGMASWWRGDRRASNHDGDGQRESH